VSVDIGGNIEALMASENVFDDLEAIINSGIFAYMVAEVGEEYASLEHYGDKIDFIAEGTTHCLLEIVDEYGIDPTSEYFMEDLTFALAHCAVETYFSENGGDYDYDYDYDCGMSCHIENISWSVMDDIQSNLESLMTSESVNEDLKGVIFGSIYDHVAEEYGYEDAEESAETIIHMADGIADCLIAIVDEHGVPEDMDEVAYAI